MKKNVLLTSILSIVICMSIICGSTFALFTSESKVNVAITSGTVKVEAYLDEAPSLSSVLGENLPQTQVSYAKEDNKITVTNMVPGDKVDFSIKIYNKSNVTVKYQTVISATGDTDLFNSLVINVGDEVLTGMTAKESLWETIAPSADSENAEAFKTVDVSILFPVDATNVSQSKSITITYLVNAVQGNAYTGPTADIYKYSEAELDTALDGAMGLEGGLLNINWPTLPSEVTLEDAWTFTAKDTEETLADSPYKDWYCDFVISCDEEVVIGELGLWGAYDGMSFYFANPMELAAEQKLPMITSVGYLFTYEMICTDVEVFDCGVFRGLAGDQMEGKTITVSLTLIDNEAVEEKIKELVNDGLGQDAAQQEIIMNIDKYFTKGDTLIVANETKYYFK